MLLCRKINVVLIGSLQYHVPYFLATITNFFSSFSSFLLQNHYFVADIYIFRYTTSFLNFDSNLNPLLNFTVSFYRSIVVTTTTPDGNFDQTYISLTHFASVKYTLTNIFIYLSEILFQLKLILYYCLRALKSLYAVDYQQFTLQDLINLLEIKFGHF